MFFTLVISIVGILLIIVHYNVLDQRNKLHNPILKNESFHLIYDKSMFERYEYDGHFHDCLWEGKFRLILLFVTYM